MAKCAAFFFFHIVARFNTLRPRAARSAWGGGQPQAPRRRLAAEAAQAAEPVDVLLWLALVLWPVWWLVLWLLLLVTVVVAACGCLWLHVVACGACDIVVLVWGLWFVAVPIISFPSSPSPHSHSHSHSHSKRQPGEALCLPLACRLPAAG